MSDTYPRIRLRVQQHGSIDYRHPWVFSGGIEPPGESVPHGAIVNLTDSGGAILGTGTYSKLSSIAVRLLDWGPAVIDQSWLERRILTADTRRRLMGYGPGTETTGYRVLFGESDGVPGCIIDRYDNTVVMQLATAGMENLRPQIVAAIQSVLNPAVIIERSDLPVRAEEHLPPFTAVHSGTLEGPAHFTEQGMKFGADIMTGQKTGFYLDQRELRQVVRRLAPERNVLNLFAYTGAFAAAALAGGAASVLNLDSSRPALARIADHLAMNGLSADRCGIQEADIFQWLARQSKSEYSMIIVDPPALIKSRGDVSAGTKAYHFLNRAALRLLVDGGIFVSSSCSAFFSEIDLLTLLRRASIQAGVRLHVLQTVRQGPDHPVSIYFPESWYLKSVVAVAERLPGRSQI